MTNTATRVAVVGAGPAGLALALELGLAGVDTLVLERRTDVDETIKAGSVGPTAAAHLRRRGLGPVFDAAAAAMAERFAAMARANGGEGNTAPAGPPKAGHFAGLWKLTGAGLPDIPGTTAPGLALMPQAHLEKALAERLAALSSVRIRRGAEITGLDEDAEGATLHLSGGEDVRAAYVCGCDGGRSTVRKLAGFGFPGTDPVTTGRQALAEIADPEKLAPGWHRTATGVYAHGPIPGRVLTVEFDGPPADRDAPITAAEVQASLRHVSGTDVTVTGLRTATRFTDNARLADDYRRGRVLLAGDAAHVHSPFGGQGLNLGLGDAANLGWKLARVLHGRAGDELLDTYAAERRPVAARVLDNTRAQIALMRPDPHTGALRDLFAELMDLPAVNAKLTALMTGLDVRYGDDGGHPLAGTFCPDLALEGTSLEELCAEGEAVLIDVRGELGDPGVEGVRYATAPDTVWAKALDVSAVLLRPDGYVGWAAGWEEIAHFAATTLPSVLESSM